MSSVFKSTFTNIENVRNNNGVIRAYKLPVKSTQWYSGLATSTRL